MNSYKNSLKQTSSVPFVPKKPSIRKLYGIRWRDEATDQDLSSTLGRTIPKQKEGKTIVIEDDINDRSSHYFDEDRLKASQSNNNVKLESPMVVNPTKSFNKDLEEFDLNNELT